MSSYGHDRSDRGGPLSSSFAPSSWSSTLGVSDALASYRRSQYIITSQNVASSIDTDERLDDLDEEALYNDAEVHHEATVSAAGSQDEDALLDELEWSDEPESSALHTSEQATLARVGRQTLLPGQTKLSTEIRLGLSRSASTEHTPLLRKTASTQIKRHQPNEYEGAGYSAEHRIQGLRSTLEVPGTAQDERARLKRKKSSTSSRSEKVILPGTSTFGQTLFNSIAILLGFGMLSEPLAFAYAGWIGGTILIVFYGTITCYTAKILAHIMADDPQIRTYADIGNKAFGPRSRLLTSSLFCLELFAVSVVLVTLFGDSLHSIIPAYSSNAYKLMGLAVLIPSVFCPLSVLSYTSILGIMSTLLIIAVLLIDGLSKPNAPGSLWHPAPTSPTILSWGELGVAFGLFMAGFSGHAVLPSLARDMVKPQDFDEMINLAFIAATIIYAFIGGCGYLMFGNAVSDEVSRDLLATPGYNTFINKLAVWSLVIMPLTKFALSTRPVNITLEILLGLEPNSPPQLHGPHVANVSSTEVKQPRFTKDILIFIERSAFTCLSVAASIFIPEFSSTMAFVGSFSAFMLCVIGPVAAKICLERKSTWRDVALLIIAIVMGTWGTVAAFAA